MNKKIYLAIAAIIVIIAGISIFVVTKSDDSSTTTTTDGTSITTSTSESQSEQDEDEDYTKVVIDPVDNITENQDAQEVNTADELVSCGYTRQTTEGPYYISGTKQLTDGNLNYDNLSGTPLRISGYVYGGADNKTPLSGAKIEIWQTDDDGSYHPNANGKAGDYSSSKISLRGYVVTDANGYYSFTSIYPGEYTGRARHIHVRASVDGYNTIVSQIIMSLPGDNMPATQDMIAKALDSSCSAPSITDVNGTDEGFYSFWLKKS